MKSVKLLHRVLITPGLAMTFFTQVLILLFVDVSERIRYQKYYEVVMMDHVVAIFLTNIHHIRCYIRVTIGRKFSNMLLSM
jgi:hypothetical protein